MATVIRGTNHNPVSVGATGFNRFTPHAQTCCCPVCTGLQCLDRTRFFAGQLLSEADLNNEQSYWLAKSRLHNRYLVGWGVVCGLQVVCGECDGWVTVQSGYALDPCGNDIIVCQDQNFNVAKAIRDCCSPAKQTPDCSPLRYNPAPDCTGTTQTWCITIEYEEQPSRLVTPLTNAASSQACGCGCSNGGSKSYSSSNSQSTSCKTSAPSTPAPVTVPAGACEATRIVEGFKLGVMSMDDYSNDYTAAPQGPLAAALEECKLGLLQLGQRKPDINDNMSPQAAYTATCNYVAAVRNYFLKSTTLTHCSVFSLLNGISVPAAGQTGDYIGIIAEITRILALAFLDCICYTLLPTCPENPCDKRVVLACVTVQDGSIIDICHFTGRKQLITLQSIGYWLGGLGFDKFVAEFGRILSEYCCLGDSRLANFRFGSAQGLYSNNMVTTAGFSSGADVHRVAAHYVAQSMGAGAVNAIAPNARAVDLRSVVNTPAESAQAMLKEKGFERVTIKSVDEDPFWGTQDPATAAAYAPAAVSADQRLNVFTQGKVVVGFEVVDPTSAKIQDLQDQITALQNQLNYSRPTDSVANEVKPSAETPAPPPPATKKKP